MANLVSSSLYERRFGPFFVSPVIAGLDQKTGKPFICGFDSIGCIDFAKDFIVSGTASDQLFGTCEGLWEPDLVGFPSVFWIYSAIPECALEAIQANIGNLGTRGPLRDDFASFVERGRQRCIIRMGSTRLHYRERQGHKAIVEGQTRLEETNRDVSMGINGLVFRAPRKVARSVYY